MERRPPSAAEAANRPTSPEYLFRVAAAEAAATSGRAPRSEERNQFTVTVAVLLFTEPQTFVTRTQKR